MSVVNILDRVTDWARASICSKVELKFPPQEETEATDAGYAYLRANPAAFAMYVPTKEKLPPGVLSPIPSVCVRFLEGQESLASGQGSLGLQLCFSAWNPGVHGADIVVPTGDGETWKRWTGQEADAYFRRTGEGWRDAWNMVDVALREIGSVTNIDGLVIDPATPVRFGPLTEKEAIPDYYPFWFAWVSFSLQYPTVRAKRTVEQYL